MDKEKEEKFEKQYCGLSPETVDIIMEFLACKSIEELQVLIKSLSERRDA